MAEVLGLSPDCEPAVAETSKESVIARELEAESFRIHGQPQSMGYKMRFRTLKLALKENVRAQRFSPLLVHFVHAWHNEATDDPVAVSFVPHCRSLCARRCSLEKLPPQQ